MRATSLLRRCAVLALLFAMSGVGHLPDRRVEPAEVAPVTATLPRLTQPAPRVERTAPVRANAVAARVSPVSPARPPISIRPGAVATRFVSRLYLRHRALLI